MKTFMPRILMMGLVISACSIGFKAAAQSDDLYYNPKNDPALKAKENKPAVAASNSSDKHVMTDYEKYVASLEQKDTLNNQEYQQDSTRYSNDQGDAGEQYYEESSNPDNARDYYYDDYTSRILRFSRPCYSCGYFDPYYYDPFYYDYYTPGWSFGFSVGSPYWRFSSFYGYPYYSYYYPSYYSSWYGGWGYPYYYGSYWRGYHGYYHSYYDGYYGYYNHHYYGDSYNNRAYYGPRRSMTSNTSYGHSVNSATKSTTSPYGRRMSSGSNTGATGRSVSSTSNSSVRRSVSSTSRDYSGNRSTTKTTGVTSPSRRTSVNGTRVATDSRTSNMNTTRERSTVSTTRSSAGQTRNYTPRYSRPRAATSRTYST